MPARCSPRTARAGDTGSSTSRSNLRAVQQGFTGDRELHVMRGLFQLLATDKLLETPNLSTQRRLQHVQTARGSAEVQLLGDCDERAQVSTLLHTSQYGAPCPGVVMLSVHNSDARLAFPFCGARCQSRWCEAKRRRRADCKAAAAVPPHRRRGAHLLAAESGGVWRRSTRCRIRFTTASASGAPEIRRVSSQPSCDGPSDSWVGRVMAVARAAAAARAVTSSGGSLVGLLCSCIVSSLVRTGSSLSVPRVHVA